MTPRRARLALVLGAGLLTGCPTPRTGSASSDDTQIAPLATADPGVETACDLATGPLAAGASMEGRTGSHALVLHATSGSHAGATTRATLRLERSSRAPAGTVTYPLIGTADLRVAEVGGRMPGAATSTDAARPGVLVLEYPRAGGPAGSRDVTVRFGSDANGATLSDQPIDGAFMALQVRRIDSTGFAGQWSSGQEGRIASGHFCARRMAER